MGRLRSMMTVLYRPPCNSRQCTECKPKVLNRWMGRVPVDTDLYAKVVTKAQLPALLKQLTRARKRGDEGDYAKLPVDFDAIIVFSDAEIGPRIDRDEIRDSLDYCESYHGRLTTSKAWWPVKEPLVPNDGTFRDDGVMTASIQWTEKHIERMGAEQTFARDRRRDYETTEEQHARLMQVAGVVTDAEYWEAIKTGHYEELRKLDWFTGEAEAS